MIILEMKYRHHRACVLLCQPEVDDVNLVRLLAKADQEVIRLDIAMDEILGMHVLNPVDHLVRAPLTHTVLRFFQRCSIRGSCSLCDS